MKSIEFRSRIKTREGNFLCATFGQYGVYSFIWATHEMAYVKPAKVEDWVWATTEWGTTTKSAPIERGEWGIECPFDYTAEFKADKFGPTMLEEVDFTPPKVGKIIKGIKCTKIVFDRDHRFGERYWAVPEAPPEPTDDEIARYNSEYNQETNSKHGCSRYGHLLRKSEEYHGEHYSSVVDAFGRIDLTVDEFREYEKYGKLISESMDGSSKYAI